MAQESLVCTSERPPGLAALEAFALKEMSATPSFAVYVNGARTAGAAAALDVGLASFLAAASCLPCSRGPWRPPMSGWAALSLMHLLCAHLGSEGLHMGLFGSKCYAFLLCLV